MNFDFSALLETAPTFERCDCGTLSTLVPCWECTRTVAAQSEAGLEDTRRGIPPRYRWARCSSPELAQRVRLASAGADASDVARRLAAAPALATVLQGPAGTGKSSLAVAAMREVSRSLYVSAAALERARIEHRAGDGEAPIVARALKAPLLVIDDLGQDKPSSVSAVEAVILARHEAELRTWVTTGLDARSPRGRYPEIEGRYGAGIARRLTEAGTGGVLRFALAGEVST